MQNYDERDLSVIGENLFRLNYLDQASRIFANIYQSNPNNVQALSILINIMERTNNYEKGITLLESWLERNPADPQARVKLEAFKEKINQSSG